MELVKHSKAKFEKNNPPKVNKPNCYVCGKHKDIVHEHHIKRRTEIKKELFEYGKSEFKTVFLCPNCHAYTHKLLYEKIGENYQYLLLATFGETDEMRERIMLLQNEIEMYYEFD